MNIGFIGLGNMGAPMAKNLAAAGHVVLGYDPAGITTEGVTAAASAEAAATGANVVITMLPNGKIAQISGRSSPAGYGKRHSPAGLFNHRRGHSPQN